MRIVSLLASATEIISALGAGDMLVGRSHECDNPDSVGALPACSAPAFDVGLSSGEIDLEVKRRIRAGEPLYHVDTERINQLRPDLLITQAHCPVCAVTPGDVRRAGDVVVGDVLAIQSSTLSDIYQSVMTLAVAIGRESAGERLVTAMRRRIEAVSTSLSDERAPSVVVIEWIEPLFAMGNWGPELVVAARGRLMLGEHGEYSRAISWEQVRDADPEFLVLSPCGFDLPRALREMSVLEALPGWGDLQAMRLGNVAVADGNRYFNRSGITIVETVELLAEILHGRTVGEGFAGRGWMRYAGPLGCGVASA